MTQIHKLTCWNCGRDLTLRPRLNFSFVCFNKDCSNERRAYYVQQVHIAIPDLLQQKWSAGMSLEMLEVFARGVSTLKAQIDFASPNTGIYAGTRD